MFSQSEISGQRPRCKKEPLASHLSACSVYMKENVTVSKNLRKYSGTSRCLASCSSNIQMFEQNVSLPALCFVLKWTPVIAVLITDH